MHKLFFAVCALLSASAAVCQETNPATGQKLPDPGAQIASKPQSTGTFDMCGGKTENRPRHNIISLCSEQADPDEKNKDTSWSPPELPPDVLQAKKAAVLKEKNAAAEREKLQERLAEKAYIFGVATDKDALQ